MFIRSLFPLIAYNTDETMAAAPIDTAPAPVESAAPVESSADTSSATSETTTETTKTEEAAPPPLEEQLSKIWDKSHLARDENGRFKSTKEPGEDEPPGDDQELSAPDQDETPVEGGQEDDQPGDGSQVTDPHEATVQMPKSWSKENEAVWQSLPPDAQKLIAQRDTETQTLVSRAGRAVETLRNVAPVLNVLEQYRPYLQQVGEHLGMQPVQLIDKTLSFEHAMRTETSNDRKLGMLVDLAIDYGIDLSPVLGPEAAEAIKNGQRAVAEDPRVASLERTVQELAKRVTEPERQARAREEQVLVKAVEDFEADTKSFPHYATVKPLMAAILHDGEDDGRPMPQILKDAYEQAVWAHPKTRELMLKEQQKRDADRLAEERRQKAANASKAAAPNVKTGLPSPSKRTMDDDLLAIAERSYGRS